MTQAIVSQGATIERSVDGVSYTAIGEVTDISNDGASRPEINATHLGSTAQEFLVGLVDPGTMTMTLNLVTGDAGQQALLADETSTTARYWRITLSNGATITGQAYLQSSSDSIAAQDKVTLNVTLRKTGQWTRSWV